MAELDKLSARFEAQVEALMREKGLTQQQAEEQIREQKEFDRRVKELVQNSGALDEQARQEIRKQIQIEKQVQAVGHARDPSFDLVRKELFAELDEAEDRFDERVVEVLVQNEGITQEEAEQQVREQQQAERDAQRPHGSGGRPHHGLGPR
jgi:predicted TIM-barrel enzyme